MGPYNLVWVMYSCNSVYDVNVKFGKQLTHNVVYIYVLLYIYIGLKSCGLIMYKDGYFMYKVFLMNPMIQVHVL